MTHRLVGGLISSSLYLTYNRTRIVKAKDSKFNYERYQTHPARLQVIKGFSFWTVVNNLRIEKKNENKQNSMVQDKSSQNLVS